ncbi:MAG: anthranilate phosphoribosyltransferase [gamma proteobacterium symbiont of Bathyaustriella thionipta]|nr:anthranilate phosphoribosyltransferase [gamma proteobacterium symbiont of Bathyaustriella thionipta]
MSALSPLSDSQLLMRSILQRIATGPDLSKDISFDEARQGMAAILANEIDPVQSALFLIALRMKRETDEENRGVLQALIDASRQVTADVREVVDIADPFDGFTRTLPSAPFLPAVLAACGVPAISQGLDAVGPKFGVTHRHVLQAAGIDVDLSTQQAAEQLANPAKRWAYVDQRQVCPALHNLTALRTQIVKRQVLTTVEVLLGPIRGRRKTHLVTGYVHKPYPPVYASLAHQSGFDSALLVRGVEGGVIPSLRQSGKVFFYHDNSVLEESNFTPDELHIDQNLRAAEIPSDLPRKVLFGDEISESADTRAAARAAAEAGLAALNGKKGATRDALVFSASLILRHIGKTQTLEEGAYIIRDVLDNRSVLAHFDEVQQR